MKNIFLRTMTLCFFLAATITTVSAQNYLSTDDALQKLHSKSVEVSEIISSSAEKDMAYYKAVATKKIIKEMIMDFKTGKSTAEVAELHSVADLKVNGVQKVRPFFPDSNGRYGTKWINEEIIILLEQ